MLRKTSTVTASYPTMKRAALGFVLRLAGAVGISLFGWWLFITPFDRLPVPREAIALLVRVLDFPVALAGELLHPLRGMELIFFDHSSWCDFCPAAEVFRRQMQLAVPVYLLLLYVPALWRGLGRRDLRLRRRILLGLCAYGAFTAAFFLLSGGGDRRGDVRLAAMGLLILSAAAAFAWSKLRLRWKAAGVTAVLLAGAWALGFLMTLIAPKVAQVGPYYVSDLVLLLFAAGATLYFPWAIEEGLHRWELRRRE